MAAIEVSALVVRYRDTTAVDGISFSAEAGSVVALLGPNGAGKTSTVETLEGYRRPASGSVRVLGLHPVLDATALAPRIGVMLQAGGVYPSMTPRQVLRLFSSYYPDAEDPDALLDRVALREAAATPWRRLSGGEQQRLSLALALVGRPEVAFLDEPTAGIDPQGRLVIRDVIRDLRDSGACVLLTTHELDEAEKLADRIVIIDRGRLVAEGTPVELMASGGGHTIRFGAAPGLDVAVLSSHLGAAVVEEQPGEYRVDASATPAVVASLTAWLAEREVSLADLRAGRETLTDVFLRLTGPSSAESDRRPRSRSGGRSRR
ncbi:MAG: ABC transporter ATP-binding protein [Actinobacteria bacterium]|nr:ABC transporter ATP-binding protein [Actinomycetota bacterium]MBW3651662.1 ABC transporter ATP-binding protein [Actinomycetota bacterium]